MFVASFIDFGSATVPIFSKGSGFRTGSFRHGSDRCSEPLFANERSGFRREKNPSLRGPDQGTSGSVYRRVCVSEIDRTPFSGRVNITQRELQFTRLNLVSRIDFARLAAPRRPPPTRHSPPRASSASYLATYLANTKRSIEYGNER